MRKTDQNLNFQYWTKVLKDVVIFKFYNIQDVIFKVISFK